MKNFGIILALSVLVLPCAVNAQDDETRQSTGLPMLIGRNSTSTTNAPISGKVIINGLDSSQPKPSLQVAVYFSGALLDKRQVNDAGFYFIPDAPRSGGIIAIEIEGIEIGRFQITPTISGSIRQDLSVTWAQIQNARQNPNVISAKTYYQRNSENQKLFDKATAESKERKTDNALSLYKQLVANDSKDFVAWTELGTLYFRDNKFSDAETAYQQALRERPDFIVALVNSGKLYLAQQQAEKAIAVLIKAVETEPASADAQHYLGEAYLQNKLGSKAVAHLNEAIKLSPIEKAEIHLRLAALYNGANLKDRAVAEYKLFLEKIPTYKDKDKIEKYIKENSNK